MKDVLKFLEDLGKNADLKFERIDFASLLNNDDFDSEAKKAILSKDSKALEILLNARSKIVCMIMPAEEEDEEEEEDQSENRSKDEDDKSDEENQSVQLKQVC